MSSIQSFSTHDVTKWDIKPARANPSGQGKSIYMDRKDQADFSTEVMTTAWPIRPAMAPPEGAQIKEGERLNLEVSVPKENVAFITKAMELDDHLKSKLYEDRLNTFGPVKAKALTSKESIGVLYKPMLKEGNMNKDGTSKYDDTWRLKVDGWSQNIEKLNFVEKDINGTKMKMVEDCTWSPRFIDQGLKSGDTKFFKFLGVNPENGKDRFTDRLPVEVNGEKKLRYVGPQDCKKGSKITIVFRITKVYITETAGPTLSAKEVYIRSTPQKEETKVMDGAELIDESELLSMLESPSSSVQLPAPCPSPAPAQVPIAPVAPVASAPVADTVVESVVEPSFEVEEVFPSPPKKSKKNKD
jgi:hypothetical protein